MGLHTEISCKECGWKGQNHWKNPKTVYLVIPAIISFLLYAQLDFDSAISGDSFLQSRILIYMALVMAFPLFHIVKTLFSNLKINRDVPDKCPGCGSDNLEISGVSAENGS